MEWIERSIDSNLKEIRQNYDSTLSEECIALIETEKSFLAGGIAGATQAWAAGDSFKTEDFIGAALVFMKSSKAFDAGDSTKPIVVAVINSFPTKKLINANIFVAWNTRLPGKPIFLD